MSTNDSLSEQEHKFIEFAFITTEKPVENIENDSDDLTTNISDEFAQILKSSHIVMKQLKECSFKQQTKIMKTIILKMDTLYSDLVTSKHANINDVVFLAQAYLNLSNIYIDSGDDSQLMIADSHISKCVHLLKEKETERRVILTAIDGYYALGSLYHIWNRHEQSLLAFQKALKLYLKYNENAKEYLAPINVLSFCSDKSLATEYMLEKQCIQILRYLLTEIANVETDVEGKTNQIIIDKVTMCKHELLKRILNKTLPGKDYIEWASQSVSLAEIFLKLDNFTAARNHLAAASFIMKKYYQENIQTGEEIHSIEENLVPDAYKKMKSEIDQQWGKYGLKLLESSQERLHDTKTRTCEVHSQSQSTAMNVEKQPNESSEFIDTIPHLKEFTVKITDKYLLCYTDAKAVFKVVLVHFNEALQYFNYHLHLLQYVNIMQDIAYAYKHLAYYEENEFNQMKLHKQRLHILKSIVNLLNAESYIDILKPIWIEVAITNSNILEITAKSRYTTDTLNTELLNRSKKSIEDILSHWQLYVNSFS